MIKESVFKKYTDEETFKKIVDYPSVTSMWESCLKNYLDKPAIIDGETYTFNQIDSEVKKVRAFLKEKGIQKGDRVGILMPNSVNFAVSFLAITTLGAVAVLLPPHLDEMAVFGSSLKFQLKGLISFTAFEEKLNLIKQKNPSVILMDENSKLDGDVPCVEVDGKDACAIIFTGGTTGKNKGALLSNQAVLRGVKKRLLWHERRFWFKILTRIAIDARIWAY